MNINSVCVSVQQVTCRFSGMMEYPSYSEVSRCGLIILDIGNLASVVVASELSDNPGASITNSYEMLATAVSRALLRDREFEAIFWVEHYGRMSYSRRPSETMNAVSQFTQVVLEPNRNSQSQNGDFAVVKYVDIRRGPDWLKEAMDRLSQVLG